MGRGLKSYANKRDGNEKIIVDAMRRLGVTVTQHDEPWDLCCSYMGISRWAEVKMPQNKENRPKPFTAKQIETLKTWPQNYIAVLVTERQAIRFAEDLKRDARLILKTIDDGK